MNNKTNQLSFFRNKTFTELVPNVRQSIANQAISTSRCTSMNTHKCLMEMNTNKMKKKVIIIRVD